MGYEKRLYRDQMKAKDLDYFQVMEFETDLYLGIDPLVKNARLEEMIKKEIIQLRQLIMDYNNKKGNFISSLVPLPMDENAPILIQDMLKAGLAAGIGPMGSVAGAISKYVGKRLESNSNELIIENGGDLFIKTKKKRRIALDTGNPKFLKLGLIIQPNEKPIGICTSSGIFGHSLSFGNADTVTVMSHDVPLADAGATALGNRIKNPEDIKEGIEWIKKIPGITGAVIIIKDQLGAWGDIEFG
jgi:ApbE superfamily uncharacterized protein (UPF0280 family)